MVVIVFLMCLALGYCLSARKVLWNDELYTQVQTIEGSSFGKIIKGDIREGNNAPLFYILQKSFLSAAQYRFPYPWKEGEGRVYHLYSQMLLRTISNICMSLAIVMLFHYFCVNVSCWAALLSVVVSLSSYMVLAYGSEARPYALWFLLSIWQLLTFLKLQEAPEDKKSWKTLGIIHCLLVLTVVISIGQIFVISLLLWLKQRQQLKKFIFLTLAPFAVCVYYFWLASSHGVLCPYHVPNVVMLIDGVFPLSYLVSFVFLALIYAFIRFRNGLLPDFMSGVFKRIASCGVLIFLFTGSLLAYYKFRERLSDDTIGYLNCRYFIYLTPLEIIATVFGVVFIFRLLKKNAGWWAWQYVIAVVFFLMIQALVLWKNIYSTSLFAYN